MENKTRPAFRVSPDEVEITAIRAQGPGGQHVNKASTAVQLRFDIRASSLSAAHKARLLAVNDQRITAEGVVVIKAQQSRSQELNRQEAMERLQDLLRQTATPPKPRKATKPTLGSVKRRLEGKSRRSHTKSLRGKVTD